MVDLRALDSSTGVSVGFPQIPLIQSLRPTPPQLLVHTLQDLRQRSGLQLLHLVTRKGAGCERAADDPQLNMLVSGLETYFDRDKRQYAHFVDGGITDNLGLRAIYDVCEGSGGVKQFMKK